jgi:hypothetical protein
MPLEMLINEPRPGPSQLAQLLPIPLPFLRGLEALRPDPPSRHEQMDVVIALIALGVGRVNRHVDDQAASFKHLGEFEREALPLLRCQLGGQGNLDLARDL